MSDPSQLFGPERPVRSDFARRHSGPSYAVRRVITLVVLLALVGGAGYFIWGRSSVPGEVPTVKADGASYKQRPEQPGGIDIPHQDVQVYHEIDGSADASGSKPSVEHMLPPPEEPVAPAAVPAPRVEVDADTAKFEDLTPRTQMETTVSPVASVPVVVPLPPVHSAAIAPVPAPVPVPVITPVPVPAPIVAAPAPVIAPVVPVPPPVASVAPPVVSAKSAPEVKGGVVVQLAASPDQHAADAMAQKLQVKYEGILGGAHLHAVRANLGAKGIFYRVQSQPLSDAQAKSICASIKNANAGCILVRS